MMYNVNDNRQFLGFTSLHMKNLEQSTGKKWFIIFLLGCFSFTINLVTKLSGYIDVQSNNAVFHEQYKQNIQNVKKNNSVGIDTNESISNSKTILNGKYLFKSVTDKLRENENHEKKKKQQLHFLSVLEKKAKKSKSFKRSNYALRLLNNFKGFIFQPKEHSEQLNYYINFNKNSTENKSVGERIQDMQAHNNIGTKIDPKLDLFSDSIYHYSFLKLLQENQNLLNKTNSSLVNYVPKNNNEKTNASFDQNFYGSTKSSEIQNNNINLTFSYSSFVYSSISIIAIEIPIILFAVYVANVIKLIDCSLCLNFFGALLAIGGMLWSYGVFSNSNILLNIGRFMLHISSYSEIPCYGLLIKSTDFENINTFAGIWVSVKYLSLVLGQIILVEVENYSQQELKNENIMKFDDEIQNKNLRFIFNSLGPLNYRTNLKGSHEWVIWMSCFASTFGFFLTLMIALLHLKQHSDYKVENEEFMQISNVEMYKKGKNKILIGYDPYCQILDSITEKIFVKNRIGTFGSISNIECKRNSLSCCLIKGASSIPITLRLISPILWLYILSYFLIVFALECSSDLLHQNKLYTPISSDWLFGGNFANQMLSSYSIVGRVIIWISISILSPFTGWLLDRWQSWKEFCFAGTLLLFISYKLQDFGICQIAIQCFIGISICLILNSQSLVLKSTISTENQALAYCAVKVIESLASVFSYIFITNGSQMFIMKWFSFSINEYPIKAVSSYLFFIAITLQGFIFCFLSYIFCQNRIREDDNSFSTEKRKFYISCNTIVKVLKFFSKQNKKDNNFAIFKEDEKEKIDFLYSTKKNNQKQNSYYSQQSLNNYNYPHTCNNGYLASDCFCGSVCSCNFMSHL